ncbi:MAG TPA: cation:proton antiporter [Gaiellaceae bacterium]|nr:cation:proton antiporter [Gaiellaceae bacterium]
MHEVVHFGTVVLVVSGGFTLALAAAKLTEYVPIPAPAVFLLAAAVASDLYPHLGHYLSVRDVERLAVVALIVILFGGGFDVGWRRFRASVVPITLLGVLGTFATAGVVALFAHWALGFTWITAGLLGSAVAPTDPAVMFSVLGGREIAGRTGTILKGESGANDPVGIALMIGMIALATHPGSSFWIVGREFGIEMAVGLAIGLAGGILQSWLLHAIELENTALHTVRTLAGAGVIYGVASTAHGSGFLAVFVAGLIVGDSEAPYRREIELFQNALSSVAEIVVFVALGLTVSLGEIPGGRWTEGVVLAVFLAVAARPLVVGALLMPVRLRPGERAFVAWGGLKGAVPILLAAFALLAGVRDGRRIYDVVFIVVAFSVIVQGASIPFAAARLGVPMRRVRARPVGQDGEQWERIETA